MATEPALREKILAHCTFPPLPAAVVHILRLTERRTVGVDELAEAIGNDAVLAGAILRAINSNFYALGRNVTSLRQAIALLGLQPVQTLVLGVALASAVPIDPNGPELAAYWRRCVYSAAAARTLAARFLPHGVEDCFIAALLMDLGTLVLDRALGERYRQLRDGAGGHAQLVKLEQDAYGVAHPEVAVMLIRHWGLPAALEVPVGAHHSPWTAQSRRLRSVAEALEVSGRCAEVFLNEDAAEAIAAARDRLSVRYAMALPDADKILARIGQKAAELTPLLRVTLETSDYALILESATPRLLEMALARRQARKAEQRRSPRQSRQGTLALYPCARGALGRELRVRLCDLSANGIGILHGRPMDLGSQFIICLPQPGGSIKSLLYTAVRCEPADNVFHIGAELRSVLNAGQSPTSAEGRPKAVA